MPQEDVPAPALPSLIELLYEFQMFGFSAHLDYSTSELRVIPAPELRLIEDIKEHYDELLYLQPGVCDQCLQWQIRRHTAYWGATVLYCGLCLLKAINLFEKHDRWPETMLDIPTSDRENNEANPTEAQDSAESGF